MSRRTGVSSRGSSAQEEIRKLKEALYMTRRSLVRMAGEDAYRVLSSYHSGMEKTQDEYENSGWMANRWLESVADDVLKLARPQDVDQSGYGPDRALCPLCHGGSQSRYATGFAIPEGLRRHLLGENNSNRCAVTEAALGLAESYADTCFD
jgi:hypothetical protein